MKIKWGALVVDGRNKVGGHVASKNRAGSYLRTKVTPINPGSTAQGIVRNRFGDLSSDWRNLTDAMRAAWNAVVADFATTDIFGDLKNPSGFNLHQKLNNNLFKVGIGHINTPPLPQAVDHFTSLSVTAANGTPALSITFAPAINVTHRVVVWATPGLSPGISFVKSQYRVIDVFTVADTGAIDALAAYVAVFGSIPAAGTKIFVKLVQVTAATGQEGLPIPAFCVVAV